jgi:hypothetical protein
MPIERAIFAVKVTFAGGMPRPIGMAEKRVHRKLVYPSTSSPGL